MTRAPILLVGTPLLMGIGWWSISDAPGHSFATSVLGVVLAVFFVSLIVIVAALLIVPALA